MSVSKPTENPPLRDDNQAALQFLYHAARFMVTYNTRTYLLHKHLKRIAAAIGLDDLRVDIGYCKVTLFAQQSTTLYAYTSEFRINIAVLARVMRVIDKVCAHTLSPHKGLLLFKEIERTAERRQWLLVALLFGTSASSLAFLAQGDNATILATGVVSAIIMLVQWYLTRYQVIKLMLPFASSFVGALLCGIWIRMGMTMTPSVCLVVPALLLIPGPHLINGLYDIVENNIQTGLARLCLAISIVIATAFGVMLGSHMVFLESVKPTLQASSIGTVSLWLDALLAGVTSCGIAALYNAPWRILLISTFYGMVGHAVRYFLLHAGYSLESSTFFACLAIGFFTSFIAERLRVAFSAVSFASAIPMMPGMLIFSSIDYATRIASHGAQADPTLVVFMLADFFKAALVLCAMVMGLLIGARSASIFSGSWDKPVQKLKSRFK